MKKDSVQKQTIKFLLIVLVVGIFVYSFRDAISNRTTTTVSLVSFDDLSEEVKLKLKSEDCVYTNKQLLKKTCDFKEMKFAIVKMFTFIEKESFRNSLKFPFYKNKSESIEVKKKGKKILNAHSFTIKEAMIDQYGCYFEGNFYKWSKKHHSASPSVPHTRILDYSQGFLREEFVVGWWKEVGNFYLTCPNLGQVGLL